MKYVTLNNGVKMPILGFGVYQIPEEQTKQAVLDALEVGYRLIDTAQSYFNESAVGDAIKETNVAREDIFLTTKIWIDNYGTDLTKKSLDQSMKKLKVDYVDLVLLHQPLNDYYAAYRVLEEYYKAGKIKSIGVSNFSPNRLADIAAFNEVIPQVNQVEVNPFHQQIKAHTNMQERHIQIEAWAPFGEGKNNIFQEPTLQEIGKAHNKSIAQVILRWLIQREVVVLAKSVHKLRLAENFDVFDFELTEQEMLTISGLDTSSSMFFDFEDPKTVDMFVELIKKRRNL